MRPVPTHLGTGHRTHRHQTSHALSSPTHTRPRHRDHRTESINRPTGELCRSPTARPARYRPDHRRADIHRLVPPTKMPRRSRVRSPSRRSSPPSLIRATHPPPTQPTRRPDPQPRHPHHRYHPLPGLPQNPRLHSQTNQPRKNHPRSPPLPQTIHSPPPLPTPRKPTPTHLTQPNQTTTPKTRFGEHRSIRWQEQGSYQVTSALSGELPAPRPEGRPTDPIKGTKPVRFRVRPAPAQGPT